MNASSLSTRLDQALPGFRDYLESDEHYFDSDNVWGVFATCSQFVRERPVAAKSWRQLAALINEAVGGPDGALDEAACTCFLETLAQPAHPLRALLRGSALEFWMRCE